MSENVTRLFGHLMSDNEVIWALQKENERLQARITELESKQRWIPVSERNPPNEVEVFGYFNNGDYYKFDVVVYYAVEDVWTADDHVLRRGAVTYWFEMPELP